MAIKYPFARYGSMQDRCDLGVIDANKRLNRCLWITVHGRMFWWGLHEMGCRMLFLGGSLKGKYPELRVPCITGMFENGE